MREHIKNNIMSFFIIVTLVNIAIFVSGMILAPEEKLSYSAFIVPVIDGILGVIPGLVMYSKRELTVKQIIVRDIIQLVSISSSCWYSHSVSADLITQTFRASLQLPVQLHLSMSE